MLTKKKWESIEISDTLDGLIIHLRYVLESECLLYSLVTKKKKKMSSIHHLPQRASLYRENIMNFTACLVKNGLMHFIESQRGSMKFILG